MTKDEALKLALEALETNNKAWKHLADSGDAGFWEAEEQGFYELSVKAITAIKEALTQTESNYKKALEVWLDKTEWVQETVKPHELGMHRADVLKQRIEEASPQRIWVGLTDEEIDEGCKQSWVTEQAFQSAVWWAEAKLKEKNGI
jgi:hypothetical protein